MIYERNFIEVLDDGVVVAVVAYSENQFLYSLVFRKDILSIKILDELTGSRGKHELQM